MQSSVLLSLLALLGAFSLVSSSPAYKQIGKISNITEPAFLEIFPSGYKKNDALWVTSFGDGPGKVFVAENIGNQINKKNVNVVFNEVVGEFKWPNQISEVPRGTVKGVDNIVAIQPDGFLVPGHQTGGLYAIMRDDTSAGPIFSKNISLVKSKSGEFYHMVLWRDLNGDGLLDIITARCSANLILGQFHGELLWLEQPKSNPLGGPWAEQVLAKGPDVLFAIHDFNPKDDVFQLYAAEFFSSKLTLFDIQEGSAGVKVVKTTLIDKTPSPYDLHILDINQNGQLNLLVTEHLGKGGGNVTAFVIPDDYENAAEYKKVTLANGFTVTEPGKNQMAPGFVTPMHQTSGEEKKPFDMLVAGDGSQRAYYMQHTGEYQYSMEEIIDVNGVVGVVPSSYSGPSDLFGHHAAQFFVPNYDGNEIFIYSF